MSFIDTLKNKAKKDIKTIILPESEDVRVLEAASICSKEEIAKIVLIGKKEEVESLAKDNNIDISLTTIVDPFTNELTEKLVNDLQEIGAKEIAFDRANCYIYATIPANVENAPTLGFIAHMDTAPTVSGQGISPRIVSNYDGKEIILNKKALNLLSASYIV